MFMSEQLVRFAEYARVGVMANTNDIVNIIAILKAKTNPGLRHSGLSSIIYMTLDII
jgi:hypothetical protein